MAVQVNTVLAKKSLATAIRAGLVVMLAGSPGIGKSHIVHEVANDYNLQMIDIRLAQSDPTDLNGMVAVDLEAGRGRYLPMGTFPLEGDPLPPGKDGWLIFFDEMNSADRGVQKAAYKVLYDKMIGERKLHPRVVMVCAGNLDTDNAIVEEMSSALQSRLLHLELIVDNATALEHFSEKGFDHRISDYLRFKPASMYTFNPSLTSVNKTYACPRTWEFTHKLLEVMDVNDDVALPLLAGTISEGVAREFITFTKIYQSLPTIAQICKAPKEVQMPSEPGTLFALGGALAQNASIDNVDSLLHYVSRMPMEFQVITLREMRNRRPELRKSDAMQEWIATHNTKLF